MKTLTLSILTVMALGIAACEPQRAGETPRQEESDASESVMPGVGDRSLDSRDEDAGASETVLPGETGMGGLPATGGTSETVIPEGGSTTPGSGSGGAMEGDSGMGTGSGGGPGGNM